MKREFLFKLAFRNLLSHKLRTVLTLLGILIGISAIVFLVSFAFGLENLVTEQVTKGDAFKLIDVGAGNSQVVKLNQETVDQISSFENVKNTALIVNAGGRAKDQDKTLDVGFYGTSAQYMDWSGSKVRWGKPLPDSSDSGSSSSIVVSQKYLDFLGGGDPTKYIGKKTILDITLSKGLMTDNKNKVLADKEFTIVGVLQDNAGATVNTNYQNLTTEGVTNFSQMKVEISDRSKVTNTRMQIENLGLKTQYVGDTVNQIDQVFSIFKVILGGFGLIALGVAALGMFNTLTISLMERIREVALMKILGMRKRDIHNIFITEAVFLGTFGGIVGILLGYLESLLANSVLNRIAIAAGGEPVNIFYLPIWFIFVVILFALSVGLLTGLYPARRASRVNALDVMRYE